MTEESVFLVTEAWMIPGSFKKYKNYKMRVNEILEKYTSEYIFHNHPFEWVFGGDDEIYPAGIGVIRFENEGTARAAIAELSGKEIKDLEKEVFSRVRCYFSRYAPPNGLKDEINL